MLVSNSLLADFPSSEFYNLIEIKGSWPRALSAANLQSNHSLLIIKNSSHFLRLISSTSETEKRPRVEKDGANFCLGHLVGPEKMHFEVDPSSGLIFIVHLYFQKTIMLLYSLYCLSGVAYMMGKGTIYWGVFRMSPTQRYGNLAKVCSGEVWRRCLWFHYCVTQMLCLLPQSFSSFSRFEQKVFSAALCPFSVMWGIPQVRVGAKTSRTPFYILFYQVADFSRNVDLLPLYLLVIHSQICALSSHGHIWVNF